MPRVAAALGVLRQQLGLARAELAIDSMEDRQRPKAGAAAAEDDGWTRLVLVAVWIAAAALVGTRCLSVEYTRGGESNCEQDSHKIER